MKKVVRIVAGLLVVMSIVVWAGIHFKPTGSNTQVTYSGTIEANIIPVQPEQSGRITELLVQEGQAVKVGDILARLDDRAARISLDTAKSQLQQAEAKLNDLLGGTRSQEISRLQSLLNQARANTEGLAKNLAYEEKILADDNQLLAAGAISQKEVEMEQNKLDSIKAQSDAAKAQVDAAQASLNLALAGFTQPTIQAQKAVVDAASQAVKAAELSLEKTAVKSPITGKVLYKHVELGQVVNTGTRLVTLVNPQDLWVRVYIPENKLNQVKVGGEALISVDSYPDRAFKGEIHYISDKAEFTPKNIQTKEERTTMVFAVKIRITEGTDSLRSGMPADVVFK